MDPDETLRNLREAIAQYEDREGDWVEAGDDIAFLFTALDDWLAKGGFAPDAWTRPSETMSGRVMFP